MEYCQGIPSGNDDQICATFAATGLASLAMANNSSPNSWPRFILHPLHSFSQCRSVEVQHQANNSSNTNYLERTETAWHTPHQGNLWLASSGVSSLCNHLLFLCTRLYRYLVADVALHLVGSCPHLVCPKYHINTQPSSPYSEQAKDPCTSEKEFQFVKGGPKLHRKMPTKNKLLRWST